MLREMARFRQIIRRVIMAGAAVSTVWMHGSRKLLRMCRTRQLLLIKRAHPGIEAGKDDAFEAAFFSAAFAYCDGDSLRSRVAINTTTDRREGDGSEVMLFCQPQAGAITRGKQCRFAISALSPHRTDCVDDMFRRKPVAAGDSGFTCRASVETVAFFEQLRARGAVDGAVNTAAAEQRGVGCIDDGIHRKCHDIRLPDFEAGVHEWVWCRATRALFPATDRSVTGDPIPRTVRHQQ